VPPSTHNNLPCPTDHGGTMDGKGRWRVLFNRSPSLRRDTRGLEAFVPALFIHGSGDPEQDP